MARASDRSVFAIAFVLWGINLSPPGASAVESDKNAAVQTDDPHTCLSAPRGAAPKGQHWYYRNDHQTGRKCWYAHAGGPQHHAAAPRARAESTAADPANPIPPNPIPTNSVAPHPMAPVAPAASEAAPPPPPSREAAVQAEPPLPLFANTPPANATPRATSPAPAPAAVTQSQDAAAQAETPLPLFANPPRADTPAAAAGPAGGPHIEILRTVPTGTPPQGKLAQADAPGAGAPAAGAPDGNAAADRSTGTETAQGGADASAAPAQAGSSPQADPGTPNPGNEDGNAVPAVQAAPAGDTDAAPRQAAGAPPLSETITSLAPTEMFFMIATALSFMVFLVAIASRIAAQRREPIITEFPAFAWSDDQVEPAGFAEQEFAAPPNAARWDNAPRDPFAGPDDPPGQDWERPPRPPLLTNAPEPAYAGPPGSDPNSLEPVLRILRDSER